MELLLALSIFLLILWALVTFQVKITEYNKYGGDLLQSSEDARSILRTMVRELRSIKPANNGAYPLAGAATSSITFYSDIDADGLQEQVRYFLLETTLKKGVIKPFGSPLVYSPAQEKLTFLAYNIKNGTSTALFEYFDNTFTGTSTSLVQPVTVTRVRLVRINLLIDADPRRSPLPRLYTSDVTLRNVKDNL